MSQETCDNLNLVVSNDNLNHQIQNDQSSQNEIFQSSQQHQIMMMDSSSDLAEGGDGGGQQEEDRMSPSSFSAPNTPLSSSNMVTTLELHPNVILGIPDPDDESSTAGILDGDRPFTCSLCQANYKTKTHLRRHMHIHMNSRPYPCPQCHKGFNRKEHLNKHLEAVHSGNKHHCPYCDKQISRVDHLRRHIKNMHTNPRDNGDKGAVLKVQVRGRKHKAQLSFLTPNFPPGTIGQTIITPIPLSATSSGDRLNPIGKGKLKQEENDTSNSSSNSDGNSTTSMTIIPSNIIGPGEGVATLAVQSTPTQKVLVHQRLPSGSSVNLAAATSGLAGLADLSAQLGGHMPLVGLSDNDKGMADSEKRIQVQILNCGECNSNFTNETDLMTHVNTCHTSTSIKHKPQPFRCSNCPRAYTRREKLQEHIRCVHQGQKFSCEFCGKELSRKDHVLRHIRSVHPEVYAASFAEIDDSQIMLDEHGRLVSISSGSSGGGNGDGSQQQEQRGRKKRTPTSASFNLPSLGDVGVLLRSVCHVCLKVFGTAYHLTRHVESCHSGDVRPFSCTACNKMFKRKDHLTKHVKSHCPTLKQEQLISSSQQNQSDQQGQESEMETSSAGKLKQPFDRTPSPKYTTSNLTPEPKQDPSMSEGEQVAEIGGMLSDGSESNSNCQALLQNLQVELGVSSPETGDSSNCDGNSMPSSSILNSSQVHHSHHNDDNGSMGGVLISGAGLSLKQHSSSASADEQANATEFSLAVIDSFMQGGVNVVVVDEEISNFLQQTSSHLTTTFPCGQCQKIFAQRDQLIAHALQEHTTEALLQAHHQHIADISFPDF